jgi:hypothetical protein
MAPDDRRAGEALSTRGLWPAEHVSVSPAKIARTVHVDRIGELQLL